MPSVQLSKSERNKAKVIFATLVVALTLKETMLEMGMKESDMFVVQSMTVLMDEYIQSIDDSKKREAVLKRVQDARVKFTKKVSSFDKGSALVGGVDVYTGPVFTISPGNRFHYIRSTMSKSMAFVIEKVPHNKEDAEKFAQLFRQAILST